MPLGKLSNVPESPPHFLPRPEELQKLKDIVLSETNQRVVDTGRMRRVGVQGMGGIGKTVLATALALDEEVRRAFRDGVFWLTFGQTPELAALQLQLANALSPDRQQPRRRTRTKWTSRVLGLLVGVERSSLTACPFCQEFL